MTQHVLFTFARVTFFVDKNFKNGGQFYESFGNYLIHFINHMKWKTFNNFLMSKSISTSNDTLK